MPFLNQGVSMASNLDKMKEIISSDKRSCDRLELPLKVRYSNLSESEGGSIAWSDFVWLDNIGGEGLGFTDNIELVKGDKLEIELKLPLEKEPFYIGAEVMWVKQNVEPRGEIHSGKFSYGLKIFRLEDHDRKKFEQFIADTIIDGYLDDQGELRDFES